MMSDGMPAAAPDVLPWFVIHAKPHREGVVELHLRRKGFDVFCPKLALPPYAADARPPAPLFPGYLFARLDLARRWHDVARTPGVKQLVGTGGVPTPLAADVVEFLKQNAAPDGCVRARPDVRPGQTVQIGGGPFAGLMGIVEHPPDARGRVRVLMRLLDRRPVPVRMPMRFVRSDWIA